MDPLAPPPPGGDQNRNPPAVAAATVLASIAVVVVVTRYIARTTSTKGLHADDYTMFVAAALAVANLVVDFLAGNAGLGRHLYYIGLVKGSQVQLYTYIGEFLSLAGLCFVKVSVALFILRIDALHGWLRAAFIANVVVLALSTTALLIVLLVQCRPIAGNWDPRVRATATCLSMDSLLATSYATAAISIFTDFVSAVLPFPIVWNLNMSRKTKISVLILMCLGVFAMVCGLVRITFVKDLKQVDDPTWSIIPLDIWTNAEFHIGIIAGSLPPCRVLYLRFVSRFRDRRLQRGANFSGGQSSRSGYSHILYLLSRVKGSFAKTPSNTPGSSTSYRLDETRGWLGKRTAGPSRDTESDRSVLPLHHTMDHSSNIDIMKTVEIAVDA